MSAKSLPFFGPPGFAFISGALTGEDLKAQAKLMRLKAMVRVAQGEEEARAINVSGRQLVGEQRSDFAASGVGVAGGSPLEVMARQAVVNELDERMARTNALTDAYFLIKDAKRLERKSVLSPVQGLLDRGATLLGAARP